MNEVGKRRRCDDALLNFGLLLMAVVVSFAMGWVGHMIVAQKVANRNEILQATVCELHQQLDWELGVVEELRKHYDVNAVLETMPNPGISVTQWNEEQMKYIFGPCR